MSQTIVSVAFAVQPGSADLLEQRIKAFRKTQELPGQPAYAGLKLAMPELHFMALMLFRDAHYDPLFLIEANFDGPPEPFWTSLAVSIGPDLLDMLQFCAVPRDKAKADRFRQALDGRQTLEHVLAEAAVWPTAAHFGNRGLSRPQIEAEAALFQDVQAQIHEQSYRALPPAQIHATLRERLMPQHSWIGTLAGPKVLPAENRADWVEAVIFAGLVGAAMAVPGAVLALVLPAWFAALLGLCAIPLLIGRLPPLPPLRGKDGLLQSWTMAIAAWAVLALAAIPWLLLVGAVLWVLAGLATLLQGGSPDGLAPWMNGSWPKALAGVLCIPAVALLGLIWLRGIEDRDCDQTVPPRDEAALREIGREEDQTGDVYQNHMGSIVLVKSGALRTLLLRSTHQILHIVLRLTAQDGHLSSMRTIHFAHWALLNDNGRLLFLSNFDGTWESYLDDFIEKAYAGTTLAWTNCTGSPLAEFLVLGGVRNGRQFKAWARHSMSPNLFWFSAYPKLTVNQIWRNNALAEGLRRPVLEAGEAALWAREL